MIVQFWGVSLLEQAAARPCIHRRRLQRRQRKPSAGCRRWPAGRAGWQGHRGSGRPCGSGSYGTGSCLPPSRRPAGRWSLWCLQQRWTGGVKELLAERQWCQKWDQNYVAQMKFHVGSETEMKCYWWDKECSFGKNVRPSQFIYDLIFECVFRSCLDISSCSRTLGKKEKLSGLSSLNTQSKMFKWKIKREEPMQ